MKEHPSECIYYNKNKWNYIVNPIKKSYGRQSYDPNYFFIDGSYYLSKKKFLQKNKSFFVKKDTKFFQLSHNCMNYSPPVSKYFTRIIIPPLSIQGV